MVALGVHIVSPFMVATIVSSMVTTTVSSITTTTVSFVTASSLGSVTRTGILTTIRTIRIIRTVTGTKTMRSHTIVTSTTVTSMLPCKRNLLSGSVPNLDPTGGRRHRTELREYLVSDRDTVIDWIVLA